MTASPPPRRVRVTAPPKLHGLRTPRTAAPEIDAQTEVGTIFVRSLVRTQLRAAILTLGALGLVVGSLPLVFFVWPGLAGMEFLGMPLAWGLLAFGIYPVLLVIGAVHVRRAERIEAAFTDVVEGS